ncbi:MAG: hypothetical protein HWE39_05765 [Oceanospirillaceae bacterium]|nr:hypothetical protein [Oceanospirillaceae bacterium]
MTKKPVYSLLSAAVAIALMMSTAQAAPDGSGGKPENPGNNGQGKPGENPGGGGGKPDKPGRGKGGLYSDLLILNRSENGLPIFSGVQAGTEEEGEAVGEPVACLQPITAAPIDDGVDGPIDLYAESLVPPLTNPLTNAANDKSVSPVPLGGTGIAGEECDVATDFVAYPQEVLFGRLNLGRAPTQVLRQQLSDVTDVLSAASQLSLDSAGRLVADGVAIDSPGQNLAIHTELQKYGGLKAKDQTPIVLPNPGIAGFSFLDIAASALGAAADKGGLVNLDLVVYDNRILNIPDLTQYDVFTGNGVIGESGEKYMDYSAYQYKRSDTYPGCVRGYFIEGETTVPFHGSLMQYVFANEDFDDDNVFAFATAADDARRVIAFVHDNIVTNVDSIGQRTDAICSAPTPPTP